MTKRGVSWETLAHRLAYRVSMQADACGHGQAREAGCGYCSDAEAYDLYLAKCASAGVRPTATQAERLSGGEDVRSVPVGEVPLNPVIGLPPS